MLPLVKELAKVEKKANTHKRTRGIARVFF